MILSRPYSFRPSNMPVTGFQLPSRRVKMRYVAHLEPSAAVAGNAWFNTFSLNSTFDPDRTGVGHQPWGRDQMATLYNTYRVVGCKVTVNAMNHGDNSVGDIVGMTFHNNQSFSTSTNLDELCERPLTTWALIPGREKGADSKIISKDANFAKITGSNAYLIDDTYKTGKGGSPTNEIFVTFFAHSTRPLNSALTQGELTFQVTLTYDVIWTEPEIQSVGQS